jgi:multisubunit Na+/H+ antiporter MnhB subunit
VPSFGSPLVASLVALFLGGVLYARRATVDTLLGRMTLLPSAGDVWDRLMVAIVRVADLYSARWQNGSIGWYVAATVLTLPALCFYALDVGHLSWRQVRVDVAEVSWIGLLLCALLAVATIAAVRASNRLAAAIATTTIGFLVSMLFVVYRSPDILLTQVLIETVSTIFVLLVLVFLPPFRRNDLPPLSRLVNAAISGAFGLTITLLLLLSMTPGLRGAERVPRCGGRPAHDRRLSRT